MDFIINQFAHLCSGNVFTVIITFPFFVSHLSQTGVTSELDLITYVILLHWPLRHPSLISDKLHLNSLRNLSLNIMDEFQFSELTVI